MAKLKIHSDVKPFTMIKNAIIDSEDILNEHEKILYIVLTRYGDKAFPSLATLSKKCGFSKSTAQRTINSLIKKGLLKKINRTSKKNGNTSNIYTLIDNDKIWISSEEDLKENIESIILEEAIKIVEASGMKVSGKEKELESAEQAKPTENSSSNKKNTYIKKDNTNGPKSPEKYNLSQIRQFFGYDSMVENNPCRQKDIDVIMNILYAAMNTDKKNLKISGTEKPSTAVIDKLKKLNKETIMYAIHKYEEQTERIINPSAYLLTILYNAPEQYYLDIKNQAAYDTAPKKTAGKNRAGDKNPPHHYTGFPQRTYDYNALEKELLNKPIVREAETDQHDDELQEQLKNILDKQE